MPKIVRYEFMGSSLAFWLLCATGVFIPVAILYLLNSTVRIEHEMDDPEKFIAEFRAGKLHKPRPDTIVY